MRVAILESIVMPAGHEVEFDRILINELKRQGHEPVLFVPENFPFKVDYGVDIVYLEGGEVVTYAGASKWKKPFLSILRERRRRSWFISAAEKIKEHNIDALIIPTGTYRYIKALLDTSLKDSKAAVHVIFHGIGKGEMDRFIKQAHRANAYRNVYLDVISLRDDMLRPDLPRVRKILPPVFLPSSELSGEQKNSDTQGKVNIEDQKVPNSTTCIDTNLEPSISASKPIKLGFFGQFRKEKNIERFIDAFVSLNYDDSVQLVVQGATVKPEDGALFESIIKKYSQYNLDNYIIYVGRIDEGKDCHRLLTYFMEYKKRNKNNLKLVLMGKAVCEIPKHPDIISLGFVTDEDKFDGISGAKALILPSKFESLSISVLEAMTLSKPVIVNGICDVLKGHCVKSNGGLYYKNFFEFEGCVNYLLEHTDVYEIMCKNARKYVEDYFQWEDIMKKFDDIIKLVGEKNEAENK